MNLTDVNKNNFKLRNQCVTRKQLRKESSMKFIKQTAKCILVTGLALMTGTVQAKQYVVKQDDNLWDIARRELGDATRWREIATLNGLAIQRIGCGEHVSLSINQVLNLPETPEERTSRERAERQRQEMEKQRQIEENRRREAQQRQKREAEEKARKEAEQRSLEQKEKNRSEQAIRSKFAQEKKQIESRAEGLSNMKNAADREKSLAEEKCLKMQISKNVGESKKAVSGESIVQMKARLEAARQKKNESEKALQLVRAKVNDMQSKKTAQTKKVEQLRKEVQTAKERVSGLHLRQKNAQSEKCSALAKLNQIKANMSRLQSEKNVAEKSEKEHKISKMEIESKIEEMMRKKSAQEQNKKAGSATKKTGQMNLLELRERKSAVVAKSKEYEIKLQAAKNEIQSQLMRLDKAQKEKCVCDETVVNMHKKIEKLAERKAIAERTLHSIEEAKSTVAKFCENLTRKKTNLIKSKIEREMYENDICALQNRKRALSEMMKIFWKRLQLDEQRMKNLQEFQTRRRKRSQISHGVDLQSIKV